MRINIALPGLEGLAGGMRVSAQYAQALQRSGHDVALVVRRPSAAPQRLEWLRRLLGRGYKFPPLPDTKGHFEALDLPIVHLDEALPVRAHHIPDADLFISTWWTTSEWVNRLPPAKGRHVHFIQDYELFHSAVADRVRAVYAQSNDKIVVAGWLQDILNSEYSQKSIVVSNGVNTTLFKAQARRRNNPPQIGFLYSGHPRKNCTLAIEAAQWARLQCPNLRGVAFGVTPRPGALPDWIHYHQSPSQEQIPKIYASCDLWLFPSKSEGFGLPIFEAMASNTPVLATRAGAAPDLVNGVNGWITSFKPEEYGQAIIDFLDQPEDAWQKASAAARETAERNDLFHAAQAFEAALLQLASNGRQ